MTETEHQEPTTEGEPVGTVVLRLLLAKVQEDDELQDLAIRRIYAAGPDALLEALKLVAFDLTTVLRGMYGDGTEAKLLAALHRELGLA